MFAVNSVLDIHIGLLVDVDWRSFKVYI